MLVEKDKFAALVTKSDSLMYIFGAAIALLKNHGDEYQVRVAKAADKAVERELKLIREELRR